jgi:hypothetical protein
MLLDVNNATSRRSWARNGAIFAIKEQWKRKPLKVTIPNIVDDSLLNS